MVTYDTQDRPVAFTDALSRSSRFEYDAADRLARQIFPDSQEVGFAYDASGNVTAITPPGRPAHRFSYNAVDLLARYAPPDVGTGPAVTTYAYYADRQFTSIRKPDGAIIDLNYDTGGRLSTVTFAGGQRSYTYHPTTGPPVT